MKSSEVPVVRHLAAWYALRMGADEEGTFKGLKGHRSTLVEPKIAEHHGRIVKSTGDGPPVEFPAS
jgi:adenylate cyclase